jgi:hypothetical protein
MRDLIVLIAFSVVLGTLVIQGLTLGSLLRALDLHDGDPVSAELRNARQKVLDSVLASVPAGSSEATDAVRKAFKIRLALGAREGVHSEALVTYEGAYRTALQAARRTLLDLRDRGDIGDDAFHEIENELDWLEVSEPMRGANSDRQPHDAELRGLTRLRPAQRPDGATSATHWATSAMTVPSARPQPCAAPAASCDKTGSAALNVRRAISACRAGRSLRPPRRRGRRRARSTHRDRSPAGGWRGARVRELRTGDRDLAEDRARVELGEEQHRQPPSGRLGPAAVLIVTELSGGATEHHRLAVVELGDRRNADEQHAFFRRRLRRAGGRRRRFEHEVMARLGRPQSAAPASAVASAATTSVFIVLPRRPERCRRRPEDRGTRVAEPSRRVAERVRGGLDLARRRPQAHVAVGEGSFGAVGDDREAAADLAQRLVGVLIEVAACAPSAS